MIAKFKKKKKDKPFKNKIFSAFLIFLVLFIIVFIVFTNWKINKKRNELSERILILKQDVQILEEKNKELEEKKSETESEDFLEKVARDQLELKKPGEEVVVIQKEFSSAEASEDKEKKTWWEKFKSIWSK
ncbi:MAG: cell division protein FtsL [bacterium]|nr:cell division protein FtsL [bacterium]